MRNPKSSIEIQSNLCVIRILSFLIDNFDGWDIFSSVLLWFLTFDGEFEWISSE